MPRRLSPATAYARGRSFEYRVRDHFAVKGYHVIRSPQSKGPYDLIVLGKDTSPIVILIQCKTNGILGAVAWNELYNLANKIGATAVLASRIKRAIVFEQLMGFKAKRQRDPPKSRVIFAATVV